MAKLSWSHTSAGAEIFRPLDGWQYEYIPHGGMIRILHRSTIVGVLTTVTSGSDTLQERSPVSAGGTIGVVPSQLDVPPLSDVVAAGDRIKIAYEFPGVGTVDGEIEYTPA